MCVILLEDGRGRRWWENKLKEFFPHEQQEDFVGEEDTQ
jgi:hypothetical protein